MELVASFSHPPPPPPHIEGILNTVRKTIGPLAGIDKKFHLTFPVRSDIYP